MLPKPLYEALPYVYFGMGMLTMAAIDSPARYFPTLLLAVAGMVVLFMRYSNRHGRKPAQAMTRGRHRL